MITIELIGGGAAIVDDQDEALVRSRVWYRHVAGPNVYVRDGQRVYLHRLILGASASDEIDHKNGNGLDNRRSNLRFVTRTQNNLNRRGVRGCYFEERTKKWRADLWFEGQRTRLGRFATEEAAHAAYLAKKKEMLGPDFELKE